MNSSAREKIFKSWQGINEEALIKDVATKGDQTLMQLCKEYWARKRKLNVQQYELIFQDVVANYARRLLTEKLVLKAEIVLRNVNRDVKCFYFQFACECDNEDLHDMIVEHLQRIHLTDGELQDLQFHWEILQQLQKCTDLLQQYKQKLPKLNLEALISLAANEHARLLAELFYASGNMNLCARVNKKDLWNLLVDAQDSQRIMRWCYLNDIKNVKQEIPTDALEQAFMQWPIEEDMFLYALKNLSTCNDIIRNFFIKSAHMFNDERENTQLVLRRICTMQSFANCHSLLTKIAFPQKLLEKGYYALLLRDFVTTRELEELVPQYPDKEPLIKFVIKLKHIDPLERASFQELLQVSKSYLESSGIDFQLQQPLVTLLDFLSNEPSVSALQCQLHSHAALKTLPYLQALAQRMEKSNIVLPTPYELLYMFRRIDLPFIAKHIAAPDIASFSNNRLSQQYARHYTLNYMHYLKQERSAYAVYYMLTDMLLKYGQITPVQLFSASQAVTEFALQHATDRKLLVHCVAFCEMIGFDTQNLRCFLRLISRFFDIDSKPAVPCYAYMFPKVERALLQQIQEKKTEFPLTDYQALMHLVGDEQRDWPIEVLQYYAKQNDWWHLLVLLQYFQFPSKQLRKLCVQFEHKVMGENFFRALLHELPAGITLTEGKRRRSFSRQHSNARVRRYEHSLSAATSGETLTSSAGSGQEPNTLFADMHDSRQELRFLRNTHVHLCSSEPEPTQHPDIFATILLCGSQVPDERILNTAHFLEVLENERVVPSLACNLLRNCVRQHLPILAVLAATASDLNHDWHWLVWLAVATDQWSQLLMLTRNHLQEGVAWVWRLIERTVRQGCIAQLQRSFNIFFEHNVLLHLFNFLNRTKNSQDFSDECVEELRLYLLGLSNDEVRLPLCPTLTRDQFMQRSIKLLLVHLQHNFDTSLQQKLFLSCICRSGLSDISHLVDFCRLQAVFNILHSYQETANSATHIQLPFEQLLQRDNNCYAVLLQQLIDVKAFESAVSLATLLQLPSCPDIIYQMWLANSDMLLANEQLPEVATFQQYENHVVTYTLPPSMLVHFLLQMAKRLDDVADDLNLRRRYRLLKQALCVIKQHHLFPNECFDRDQIEYDMTYTYLQINIGTTAEQLYHSEYFEQIMLKERCVLYKSFLELKELAGIEDLNVQTQRDALTPMLRTRLETLLNFLLDKGDIVEALRLQELFDCRPIDLRFVVFCMALAEGVTTIFSLSPAERKYLSGIEKSAFARFNKRTLDNVQQEHRKSPTKQSYGSMEQMSDSCSSTIEFEEIPAKEKRETLEAIQGIVSKLQFGLRLGKRILMSYRAAMYLDKEYLDVLRTKDIAVLLRSVAAEDCLHRLLVVSDILTSTSMTDDEIATLLAYEITTAVVRPRFYIFTRDQDAKQISAFKNAHVWGCNIDRDLHLFFELTPNVTKVGYCLLQYCDGLKAYRKYQDGRPYEHSHIFSQLVEIIKKYGVPSGSTSVDESSTVTSVDSRTPPPQVLSHKKQNLMYVELLIKAHECFVQECCMEGIACVLNRAKLLNGVLTKAKSWSLIVRLLTGIARYREMFYCFDALIANDQFESLLGQFEEEKCMGLRQAIIAYLREYTPENAREYLKLAALHFLMYKELAEMWEQDARSVIDKLIPQQITAGSKQVIKHLKATTEVMLQLQQALEFYTNAAENSLLDNKLMLAQKHACMAELIAMQIDLTNKALSFNSEVSAANCICVINVQTREEFRELVSTQLSVPQALILSRAYGYDINWSEALLTQYVLQLNTAYLGDYLAHLKINDALIENIVKGFQLHAEQQNITPQMEQHLSHLVDLVQSVTLKYKVASVLAFKSTIMSLINGPSMYYLKDTNYGRKENHNIPDI